MGMIQRDDMGWEVGGGFMFGIACTPAWIHVNVWQNQYSIVKQNKVKIKIKKFKKVILFLSFFYQHSHNYSVPSVSQRKRILIIAMETLSLNASG